MSEPFIGEIRIFGGNFAPRGWALCDGQLLAVSQNDALFSLLGTIYGGDGRTTFGLPDMRGRVPVHAGTGPGLSNRRLGAKGGTETVTLSAGQVPSHNHGGALRAVGSDATSSDPTGRMFARATKSAAYHTGTGRGEGTVSMASGTLTSTGGNQPHTNLAPTLCLNFIIALVGIYPSRN
jgi:microcystin-dependent protein